MMVVTLTRPIGLILLLSAALFWGQARGVEFFYTVLKGAEQCFEEHLPGQTLVTGGAFFGRGGPLVVTVLNPKGNSILLKVPQKLIEVFM